MHRQEKACILRNSNTDHCCLMRLNDGKECMNRAIGMLMSAVHALESYKRLQQRHDYAVTCKQKADACKKKDSL